LRGKSVEVEFLGEFKSIFENALDHESEDQLDPLGEIYLRKKISRYSPFNIHSKLADLLVKLFCKQSAHS
jgi:hypothetical protein